MTMSELYRVLDESEEVQIFQDTQNKFEYNYSFYGFVADIPMKLMDCSIHKIATNTYGVILIELNR